MQGISTNHSNRSTCSPIQYTATASTNGNISTSTCSPISSSNTNSTSCTCT
ncbi:MAG: hypothetical protein ACK56I_29080 [bacterium]